MDQKTKNIIRIINAETPFNNPTAPLLPQVANACSASETKAVTLISKIKATLPPPVPPSSVTTIPPLEQSWIDCLNRVITYCSDVNSGCSTGNTHIAGVVSTFSENIGLHSMGASVIEDCAGGGTDKFNQAYELVKSRGAQLMMQAFQDLENINSHIPEKVDKEKMPGQISTLAELVKNGTDYCALYSDAINSEKVIKAELLQAARDYVLASQSQTWAGQEHTMAIISATASDSMKEALKS